MDIILPIIILIGIGIFTGALLSIASIVFAVKVDEREEKIAETLPGVNCGGCGFSGCNDYAQNLVVDEETKTNLCTPGGSEVALKISEILEREFSSVVPKHAIVACNGKDNATQKIFRYQGEKTCRAASGFYMGDSSCDYGCLGFGDCEKVCVFGAICIIDGIAVINQNLCTGCGTCISECPKKIISMTNATNNVHVLCSNIDTALTTKRSCTKGCLACKRCDKACNFNAIMVINNKAIIDYKKCTNCEECVTVCPTKCIINNKRKEDIN